jgi:predicted glycoside hydrolase/deacetylase ChbG (UPF0249 family)
MLGQLKSENVAAQTAAPYAQFVQKSGRQPDFIDGHLHAHQLPGVREGLMDFVRSLPTDSRPSVRNTQLPLHELWKRQLPWIKATAIEIFGYRMLRELRRTGIRTNAGFAGIYDFRNSRRYAHLLPGFFECLSPGEIWVVHAGTCEVWRSQELAALRGFTFPIGSPNRLSRNA